MSNHKCTAIGLLLAIMHLLAAGKEVESSTDPEYLRRMPHLSYDLSTSIYLPSESVWQPGLDTLVTALMADTPLVMHLKPTLHMSLTPPVAYQLLYKCSANQSEFQSIPLLSKSFGKPATYCQQSRPFKLVSQPGKDDMYNISLTRDNNIDFHQAMRHFLEFRVLVSFANGDVKSGSLFVYNLDALNKLNSAPTETPYGVFRQHVLTDKAIKFVATLNAADSAYIVPFLSPEFTTVLNKAALITRSSFSLSLMITTSDNSCIDGFMLNSQDIVFTSGDPDTGVVEHVAAHPVGYIEPSEGILSYSASTLDVMKKSLAESTNPITVCLRIVLNHPIWDYKLILRISDNLDASKFVHHKSYNSGSSCSIGGTNNPLQLTLVEGMRDVVLINPIVCRDSVSNTSYIFYNDKKCYNIRPDKHVPQVIWVMCHNDRFSMSNGGHVIVIEGPIDVTYSGKYRFMLHGQDFAYFVTVLSLPRFNTTLRAGALQHTTFANINIPVSLTCTVYYDGMKYVKLKPLFRVYELLKKANWKEMSLDDFATQILKMSPTSIVKTMTDRSQRDRHTTLSIELPNVEYKWRNWILVYTCTASVSEHDKLVIGLPYYSQTSTDVVYFGAGLKSLHPFASSGISGVQIGVRAALVSIVVSVLANLMA